MVEQNSTPRISINKLAEYLNANATRRQRIVKEQKTPLTFIVARYREADEAIKSFIISGFDIEIIENAIQDLIDKECESDHQNNDRDKSIQLLDSVLDMYFPDLSDCDVSPYDGSNPKITVSGVDISVRPELIIRRGNKVGAIKIHRIRTHPLDEEQLKSSAVVLHEFVEKHVVEGIEEADPSLCYTLDCINQIFESTPKSWKRRRDQIESACKEIFLWWDAV